jgi:hypothetical protein
MAYIGKSPQFGVRSRFYFTATGSETSISGTSDGGGTLLYTDGAYVDVYLNGVLLVAGTDYNTTTANTIGGLAALSANDIVEIIVYDVFSVANTLPSTGGTISGTVVLNEVTLNKAVSGKTETATLSANKTIDFDTNQNFVYTLGASINLTNPTTDTSDSIGQSGFIMFIQDGTGSRTVSPGSNYTIPGGGALTLSTAANAVDMVPYVIEAADKIRLGTPQLAYAAIT